LNEAVLRQGVETRVVSDATLVLPSAGDMGKAVEDIKGLMHQIGFTNFA
jgi:hypothetical protein